MRVGLDGPVALVLALSATIIDDRVTGILGADAAIWAIEDEHKTYIFKIKPGVKFTDGTSLDANAIVTNFNRWLSNDPNNANPNAKLYLSDYIGSVRGVDDAFGVIDTSLPGGNG